MDSDHRFSYGDYRGKRKDALVERLHRRMPRAQLVSAEFTDIDSFDDPATLNFTFTLDHLRSVVGDRILLTPSRFDAPKPVPLTSDKRLTPVSFEHAQTTSQRITYHLPAGYEVGELPKPALIREGALSFVANCMMVDGAGIHATPRD